MESLYMCESCGAFEHWLIKVQPNPDQKDGEPLYICQDCVDKYLAKEGE